MKNSEFIIHTHPFIYSISYKLLATSQFITNSLITASFILKHSLMVSINIKLLSQFYSAS